MKKYRIVICCLVFAWISFAVADQTKDWREIVESLGDKYGKMMLDSEWGELVECYDEEVVLMRPLSPPIVGLKAMKKELKELTQQGMKYHSLSGEVNEGWQCGDLIYERGTLAFSYSTKFQPKPEAYYGSYFTVWKKQKDSSFKIKCSIWNLDFNPWEQ